MVKQDFSKKIILAIGAHPDDIDIGCSGTVAKCIKSGGEAYYLVLTDGSKGYEDHKIPNSKLTKMRREEQSNAAKILGVKKVFFLDFVDGELENTPKLRKEVIKIIRTIKPTTVMCFDPTVVYDENRNMVNHPDHRVAGQVALDCVYPFARNSRTFPELMDEGLEPHIVDEVLMTNFSKANYFVDISKTIELKQKAIACHVSQFRDMDKFVEMVKQWSSVIGKKAKPKANFAEAFVRITLRQPS